MKKLWLKKGPQEMGMMQEGVVSKVKTNARAHICIETVHSIVSQYFHVH